jgi:hypothetical protein
MDLIFATLTIAIKISRNKIKEFFGEKVNDKLLAIFFFSLLLSRLSDSLFWIFFAESLQWRRTNGIQDFICFLFLQKSRNKTLETYILTFCIFCFIEESKDFLVNKMFYKFIIFHW